MASTPRRGGDRPAQSRHSAVRRLAPWAVSWLQVRPLAIILIVLFALPTLVFLVVSFFDYDRVGIYPAFLLDNYQELLTTPATYRVYLSSLKFAFIVWAITLFLGFNIAYFLVFHVRSATIRTVLFLLCAIPFWTSGIIRTIAWIPFLGRNGAFNQSCSRCTSSTSRSTSYCSPTSRSSSPTCTSSRC